jgi:cold shock CspA family protein
LTRSSSDQATPTTPRQAQSPGPWSTHRGEVVAFDRHRGLGEVADGQGRRFRFHCSQILDGTRDIPVGARVDFEVVPGHLGSWEAVALRPAGG